MAKNVSRGSLFQDLTPKKPTQEYTHTPTYTPTPTPVVKELKDKRVNLLMKPSVVEKLDNYAKSKGTSRNDILDKIVEEFLKSESLQQQLEDKYFRIEE